MHLLLNRCTYQLKSLQVHRSRDVHVDVPGNVLCDLTKAKVNDQIMYFLINASLPKPLNVSTSTFAGVCVT